MTRRVHIGHTLTSDPCQICGSRGWIVDADELHNPTKVWILCLGPPSGDCVETRDLPAGVVVVPDDEATDG